MIDKKDLYDIGVFGRPHGVKGETALVTNRELPEFDRDSFIVCAMDGIFVPFFIESFRTKSANVVFLKFENIDSEQDIKIFTGKTAYLYAYVTKESEKPEESTFVGYQAVDEDRSFKGVVTDMDDSTANTLLKVDCQGKDIILPLSFSQHISHTEKIIYIKLPEGLLEIYD